MFNSILCTENLKLWMIERNGKCDTFCVMKRYDRTNINLLTSKELKLIVKVFRFNFQGLILMGSKCYQKFITF